MPANAATMPQAACDTADQREMRRRAAIEPIIGHLKAEHRMDRNHLAHGDAVKLAAAGYNFSLLLTWLRLLLFRLLIALSEPAHPRAA